MNLHVRLLLERIGKCPDPSLDAGPAVDCDVRRFTSCGTTPLLSADIAKPTIRGGYAHDADDTLIGRQVAKDASSTWTSNVMPAGCTRAQMNIGPSTVLYIPHNWDHSHDIRM